MRENWREEFKAMDAINLAVLHFLYKRNGFVLLEGIESAFSKLSVSSGQMDYFLRGLLDKGYVHFSYGKGGAVSYQISTEGASFIENYLALVYQP